MCFEGYRLIIMILCDIYVIKREAGASKNLPLGCYHLSHLNHKQMYESFCKEFSFKEREGFRLCYRNGGGSVVYTIREISYIFLMIYMYIYEKNQCYWVHLSV